MFMANVAKKNAFTLAFPPPFLLRCFCIASYLFFFQDMIVLVTGRRVLMVHGDTSAAVGGRRHIYGVVEWQVDFDLVVWLETDDHEEDSEGGDEEDVSPSPRDAQRGPQATVSVYHFPDLCVEGRGDGRVGVGEHAADRRLFCSCRVLVDGGGGWALGGIRKRQMIYVRSLWVLEGDETNLNHFFGGVMQERGGGGVT